MSSDFIPPLHPGFRYQVEHAGNEKNPVLIIDNFIDRAELLVDIAERYCHFQNPTYLYPGIQALVPPFYNLAIETHLREIIYATFSLSPDCIHHINSLYSLVIAPPDQLLPGQSRPHVDCGTRSQLAAVHYLCSDSKGGTSLYRHKATGFEEINDARAAVLDKYLLEEEKDPTWQKKYIHGSNQHYEQIASYEAIFNRMIIYHGNVLHSGNIAPDFNFDPHPRTGRLTLTSFIHTCE